MFGNVSDERYRLKGKAICLDITLFKSLRTLMEILLAPTILWILRKTIMLKTSIEAVSVT